MMSLEHTPSCGERFRQSVGEGAQVYPKMDGSFAGDFLMQTPRKADAIRKGFQY